MMIFAIDARLIGLEAFNAATGKNLSEDIKAIDGFSYEVWHYDSLFGEYRWKSIYEFPVQGGKYRVSVSTVDPNDDWGAILRIDPVEFEIFLPHEHDGITFEPWTSTTSLPTESGSYYLTADVTLSNEWLISGGTTVSLCLNGKSVSGGSGSVISIRNDGVLNLYDDVGTGTVTGSDVINLSRGILNLYGGTIVGSGSNNYAVWMKKSGSTFNMYGGLIADNFANMGGVYVEDGAAMNLYGGAITNNTAYNGGGMYVLDRTSVKLYGGMVSGNNLGDSSSAYAPDILAREPLMIADTLSAENVYGVSLVDYLGRATDGVITSGLYGRGDVDNFTSGNPDYVMTLSDDGEAMLTVKRYSFSYNENGAESGALPTAETYVYDAGTSLTVLDNTGNLAKDGLAFTGWNTAADGSGTPYAPGETLRLSEDTVLYAQWTRAWPVTLHLNGGTLKNSVLTYYVEGVGTYLPTDVEREDYYFDGWYDNEAMLGKPVTKIGTGASGPREFWVKWFYSRFHVFVATPDGAKTMYTGMEPIDTIEVLKEMIAERTGIPAARVELTFGGRVLSNSGRFTSYNIQKGSGNTLHLLRQAGKSAIKKAHWF